MISLNAAERQELSLAEQLRMSPDQIKITADRLKFMLKVRGEKTFTSKNTDQIYGEWEELAYRLKKGRKMLDNEPEGKRLEDIKNLYAFLLIQLGLYDRFFQEAVSESHYRALQHGILNILEE